MIASNLANFPTLLENMMWIKNFSLADGQLVGTFEEWLSYDSDLSINAIFFSVHNSTPVFFFLNQISDLHPFDLNLCLKVWSMSELTWFNSSKRQSCYKNSLGVTLFFSLFVTVFYFIGYQNWYISWYMILN